MDINKLKEYHWKKILTRPFNLFGASIWNEWYSSDFTKEIFGVKTSKGLFIELINGSVSHFRENQELKEIETIVRRNFNTNPQRFEILLNESNEINIKAKKLLEQNTFNNVEEAVKFLTHLALLSTILPYVIGEVMGKNKIFSKLKLYSMMLRGISLYPKIIKKVIEPLVVKEMRSLGVNDKDAYFLITYKELLDKDISKIKQRLSEKRSGKQFVYVNIQDKESILWVKNSQEIVDSILKLKAKELSEIKGNVAYPGIVEGKARLIFTNELSKLDFHKGDILVAHSTNPSLLPIIKIAGAIVTDEGGIMSHASIISRELKIPCIVGTKIATQIIKDDDIVEVNTNTETVRIIDKSMK